MLLPIPTLDPSEYCQKENDEAEKEAEESKSDEADAQPSNANSPFHDIPSLEEDITDDDDSSVFGGSPHSKSRSELFQSGF